MSKSNAKSATDGYDEDEPNINESDDENSEASTTASNDDDDDDTDDDDDSSEIGNVEDILKDKSKVKITDEDAEIELDDEDEDDDDEDDDDEDENEDDGEKTESLPTKRTDALQNNFVDNDESDTDEEPDEKYLQKFDEKIKKNIIEEFHPELQIHNNEEIEAMSRVIRNDLGVIIDPLHKTLPFLTKYEKARILGERAKQLNSGATPFIKVDVSVIDGYLIALQELEQKCIPFIIKRPLPNGGCEYWKLKELEFLE